MSSARDVHSSQLITCREGLEVKVLTNDDAAAVLGNRMRSYIQTLNYRQVLKGDVG